MFTPFSAGAFLGHTPAWSFWSDCGKALRPGAGCLWPPLPKRAFPQRARTWIGFFAHKIYLLDYNFVSLAHPLFHFPCLSWHGCRAAGRRQLQLCAAGGERCAYLFHGRHGIRVAFDQPAGHPSLVLHRHDGLSDREKNPWGLTKLNWLPRGRCCHTGLLEAGWHRSGDRSRSLVLLYVCVKAVKLSTIEFMLMVRKEWSMY